MFPLYVTLEKKSSDKPLTTYKINQFLKKVKNISQEDMEIIFVLIYSHYIKTNKSIKEYIPYNGKYISKMNISFSFKDLPNRLQQVLYLFIKKIK